VRSEIDDPFADLEGRFVDPLGSGEVEIDIVVAPTEWAGSDRRAAPNQAWADERGEDAKADVERRGEPCRLYPRVKRSF
jgi:hypothetical protein